MEESFKLIIRTPEQTILDDQVKMLHLATEGGEIEVYANHSSLTATIAFSPVEVQTNHDKDESYMVRNGVFLFDNETNTAAILALHCEHKSEVSHQTIKEYADFIESELAKGKELSDFQILYLKGEKLAVEQQMKEVE